MTRFFLLSAEPKMKQFPGYDSDHEDAMRMYFMSLPEDHRRRYAAIEALKIGRSGIAYIARLFGMSRRTIYTGIRELQAMADEDPDHPKRPSGGRTRIRRRGGGRPRATRAQPGLARAVEQLLEAHTAGSPTDETVRWTDLNPARLAKELVAKGYAIGRNTAARLLEWGGYRRRALRKELITGQVDPQERDQQFRHIARLRRDAQAQQQPLLCVDTKKKEPLGTLHRPGTVYGTAPQKVYDHDYRHLARGRIIPHGVYDPLQNRGFVTLGTSHETSESVCDAIAMAWETQFCAQYPKARALLLTFDSGGANAARSTRFKEDLIALSRRLGLRLRIAHYPPYTSKWHPIEHRLFSQIERSLRGTILDSPETVLAAVRRTTTETGLTVGACLLDRMYQLGRTCSENFNHIKDQFIRHDEVLGKWNYVVDANGFV
jgi:hypothetical protein